MLVGLDDFNVDMFMTFEDKNIFIYLSDFETIPGLVDLVPLGSFDSELESYLWINLDRDIRMEVALLFMQRDLYMAINVHDKKALINRSLFMTEFYNIPEVTSFFDNYKNICKNHGKIDYPIPKSWTGWDKPIQENWIKIGRDGSQCIDWDNYPYWCQTCPEFTFDDPDSLCAGYIPVEVISPDDLYFISLVYFNGIYRVNPESIQDFGVYEVMTDIDFSVNKYSIVVDIKKFFVTQFQWFLQTVPGNIPFACDFGSHIKHAVQTKNDNIRQTQVQNEIDFFIHNFNNIYGKLVKVQTVHIRSVTPGAGGDAWVIDVDAIIQQERLIYRIETAHS